MATPHRGYDIHRSPVPITGTDGKETTGFEFTVTQNGKPIDIIVTATLAERREDSRKSRRPSTVGSQAKSHPALSLSRRRNRS
jgi:hypothetical protein